MTAGLDAQAFATIETLSTRMYVKAEARPASRFTRLSMLSNIATATSRQFLEKIPPPKYLENKSSFAIARGELLAAYD